jgi:hypothetical protein
VEPAQPRRHRGAKSVGSKGQGGYQAEVEKKPTTRTFRTAGGLKVTIEFKRGLDSSLVVAALREALRLAEDEVGVDGQAA